jgi:hypothetical protein
MRPEGPSTINICTNVQGNVALIKPGYFLHKVLRDVYTVKKEKKIFLMYKGILMGSGAKSYKRKGIFNQI